MRVPAGSRHPPSGLRRYLIHLFCTPGDLPGERRYVLRIRPWTPRNRVCRDTQQRLFEDESEMIQTVNPLLPPGSDVRHILSHVESPEGFLYLLQLNSEQAGALGWRD
jgi:hypothetical protein